MHDNDAGGELRHQFLVVFYGLATRFAINLVLSGAKMVYRKIKKKSLVIPIDTKPESEDG